MKRNATAATTTLDPPKEAVHPGRTATPFARRKKLKSKTLIALGILAALLLTALAVVWVLFRQDMADARTRLRAQPTQLFKSRYGEIQYQVVGSGPTVLVSHGITGGVDQAESLVTQWRVLPDEYRFIYVSRFGYLESSVPEGASSTLQAAAYRELLDHLGINRVFIAGNSAGGPSAMWFAIQYPERTNGLILVSSAVPGPEPSYIPNLVAENDFIYWAAVKSSPDKLLEMFLPKSIIATMTDEQRDFAVKNAFVASMPISQRTDGILFDNRETLPKVNNIPFEQILVRTLIFQAVDDPREYQGGQEMARRIPASQFVGLTGGHLLLAHDSEIRTAIHDFIGKAPE
jgi:pimeloyl-ACP methyl ester carboxylesterase